jgi:RNA polymerase sigma-70 factor (ECF subfamily)
MPKRSSQSPEPDRVSLPEVQEYLRQLFERLAPNTWLTSCWQQFYAVYSAVTLHFFERYRLSPEEIEDGQQEVWAAVMTHAQKLDPKTPSSGLRAWLYVIVENKAKDLIKKRMRRAKHLRGFRTDEEAALPAADRSPPVEVEAAWERARARVILDQIEKTSDLDGRIYDLREIKDQSTRETAALLDITPQKVRKGLHRFRRKLHTMAGAFFGSEGCGKWH